VLASIRWRSGLDDDLGAVRAHAEEIDARRAELEAAQARLAGDLRQASERLEDALAGCDARLRTLESRLSNLEGRQGETDGAVAQAIGRVDEIAGRSEAETNRLDMAIRELAQVAKPGLVWGEIAFRSAWSSLAPLAEAPTISIVLPTRNRSAVLRRAIDSVLAQSYPRWQLLVIDDASTDDTASVVGSIHDDRVVLVRGDGAGAGKARNEGLRAASGSIVAFLDDDNLMAPGWLRAVVAAFQDRPELSAVYGAQLRDTERTAPDGPGLLFVTPFDWKRLLQSNFVDLGVVAHRAGLADLWFDEALPRLIDWDYIVKLAGRFGLEPLPVVASLYTTDAPGRISHRGDYEHEAAKLRERFREAFRPAAASTAPAGDPPGPQEAPGLEARGSSKAWMTAGDADLLQEILARLAARFGGELRVLEWGAGLSTLHYPAWLAANGVRVSWLAIEHDRDLFGASLAGPLRAQGATVVQAEALPGDATAILPGRFTGVTAVVFDKGPINPFDANPTRYAERAKDLDDYVGLPARLGVRVHVAIVDGRKRRRCLVEAASLLEPGGVALLHDAQRPYYHPAFAAYRSGRRIGDELWIGGLDGTDFSDLVPGEALAAPGIAYVPGT
jgi:hypothetical protein